MTNIKEGLGICYSYINIFIKTCCSQ